MRSSIQKAWIFCRGENGPTAVEYAVMLALIVMVCLASVRTVGNRSKTRFTNVARTIGS